MRHLTLGFLLVVALCRSQAQPVIRNNLSSNLTAAVSQGLQVATEITVDNAMAFTNAMKIAPVGATIRAVPGRYHFLSTDLAWWTNNLSYDFRGSTVVYGVSGDPAKPFLHDVRAASTNYWIGGDIIVSNADAIICYVSNVNSRVSLNPRSLYRPSSTRTAALIQHDGGVVVAVVDEYARNSGYDFYWHSGATAPGKAYIRCPRVIVGSTVLELSANTYKFAPGDAYFEIAHSEPDPLGLSEDYLFFSREAGHLRFSTILLKDRLIQLAGATSTNQFVMEGELIDSPDFTSTPMQSYGFGKIKGATMRFDGSLPTWEITAAGLTLDNCRLIATNGLAFSAGSAFGVTIDGKLWLQGAPDAFVALNGEVVGSPKTNSYSGHSNVVWNIGGHNYQVLVATNAMLLMPTNSAALASGKESTLTIYNNTSSNMQIAIAPAGIRYEGPFDQGLLNGANSLTNGRVLTIKCRVEGTNRIMRVTHQR